jgi:hypothetical protein
MEKANLRRPILPICYQYINKCMFGIVNLFDRPTARRALLLFSSLNKLIMIGICECFVVYCIAILSTFNLYISRRDPGVSL